MARCERTTAAAEELKANTAASVEQTDSLRFVCWVDCLASGWVERLGSSLQKVVRCESLDCFAPYMSLGFN
jgi:hypothetical protein